jgi:site-specific recombinase XerD
LLLGFAKKHLGKSPSELLLNDLDAPFVGAFLNHLETERKNNIRTRNARLAAIHSFFHYVDIQQPDHAALIQRVLAIPQKRYDRNIVNFLTRLEIDALLAAPDQSTWIGRRDYAMLVIAIQTGLRVSEFIRLQVKDIVLTAGPHVRCCGKGRKERCIPLTQQSVSVLRGWIKTLKAAASDYVFPSRRGAALSHDAVEKLVIKYVSAACKKCPSLIGKRVTPHVFRHTNAVNLLQAGVDCSVIALWLGHESIETTQIYLHADLSIKERALSKTSPLDIGSRRFKPSDDLLAFLNSL